MKALRVLLVLAALAGCWWLMADRQQPPAPSSVPDAPTAPEQQPGRPRTMRPDRTEADLPAQPAAEDAQQEKAQATITGQIVRMEDGGGFAGCHVAFELASGETVRSVSDERGAFAIAVPCQEHRDYLTFSATGRITRFGSFESLPPGAVRDFGTIPMQLGHAVSGAVVDMRGQPVAGVRMTVAGYDNQVPAGGTLTGSTRATSGEDGTFSFEGPLPPGLWQIDVRSEHILLEETFTIEDGGAPPLRLIARDRPRITGSVKSADGTRITHLTIRTSDGAAAAATSIVGDFVLETDALREGPVDLIVDSAQWPDAPRMAARWGDRDVAITLPDTPPITILVRDDQGAPVEEFAYWMGRDGFAATTKAPERYAGGKLELQPSGRGRFDLRVIPRTHQLLASPPIPVLVTGRQQAPVEVTVQRMKHATVHVVDERGNGVAGVVATLFHCPDPAGLEAGIRGIRQPSYDWHRRYNEQIYAGRSDADGIARLHAPTAGEDLMLQLRTDRDQPLYASAAELARMRHQQVVWRRSGRIRGQVDFPDGPADGYAVEVRPADGRTPRGRSRYELDDDGRFESEPIAAGAYTVRLLEPMRVRSTHTNHNTYAPARVDEREVAAPVRVEAGTTSSVKLEAPRRRVGALRGRLTCASGGPLPRRVWLCYLDHAGGERGDFPVDRSGRFHATDLRPGRYRLGLGPRQRQNQRGRTLLSGMLDDVVVITADRTLQSSFTFAHERTRCTILGSDDRRWQQDVFVRYGGRTYYTGGNGELVFEHALQLPVAFAARESGPWTAPIRVQGGPATVRLP